MRKRTRSFEWVAGVLLSLVLLLGACGEPQDAAPEADATPSSEESRVTAIVAASGQHLLDEGSARVGMRMSTEMPDAAGGGLMTGTGTGAFDYETNRGYLNLELSMSEAPQLGSMTIKTIVDFPEVYMNMTDMLRMLGAAPSGLKPWIRIDFAKMSESLGIDLGAMARFGQSDAGQYAFYTKGVVDAEKEGTEEVRGQPATHYSATVDLEKLQEQDIPEGVRSSLEATVELTGTSEIPFEVWLDEQDRMVRQRMEIPVMMGATGEATPMTMDMTYYGFGRPVDIELPPPNKVMDFQELLQLSPGSGSTENSGEGELAPPSDTGDESAGSGES